MSADIDIDLPDRTRLLELIQAVPARIMHQGSPRAHNSGVYVTDIPRDPFLGTAAVDYHEAEQRGYFKLDLLNVSVYQLIKDQDHYQAMLERTPPWSRLWEDTEWAQQIVHIGNYVDLLRRMKPDSVPRMAAFISIIRPGKAHLQGQDWATVFSQVWDGDNSQGFVFKKSHAVSYACLVALHMNLLDLANQGN
jgi:hypothetical protein